MTATTVLNPPGRMSKKKKLTPRILSALNRESSVYTHHAHDADAASGHMVIGSYNIHKCVGTDGRFDPARTLGVIAEMDADILALQEAHRRFGTRDRLLDLDAIEEKTGLVPVRLDADNEGWHGNAILHRRGTVQSVQRINLPGAEPRGAVIVDFRFADTSLRLIAAHLGLLRHSRRQQIRAILDKAGEADGRPTIILGDLNEWRVGRGSSLRPLMPAFSPVNAVLPSFPARFPILPLDRVLGTPHDLVKLIEVHDTAQARLASDHLPLRAHVELGEANPCEDEESDPASTRARS